MRYLVLILLTGLFSCSQTFDRGAAKKEIIAVLMQQQKFWNAGDLEGYMKGYYKSDSLKFVSGGNVTYGWQTTLDHYKKSYPDKETMGRLTFSELEVNLLSEKAAVVTGKWELQRENDHPWGMFTLVFKKTGCGWRIIHDHTSLATK